MTAQARGRRTNGAIGPADRQESLVELLAISAAQMSLTALSRHLSCACQCLLSGVKRTWRKPNAMSAYDPKRTLSGPATFVTRRLSSRFRDRIFELNQIQSSRAQTIVNGLLPSTRRSCPSTIKSSGSSYLKQVTHSL